MDGILHTTLSQCTILFVPTQRPQLFIINGMIKQGWRHHGHQPRKIKFSIDFQVWMLCKQVKRYKKTAGWPWSLCAGKGAYFMPPLGPKLPSTSEQVLSKMVTGHSKTNDTHHPKLWSGIPYHINGRLGRSGAPLMWCGTHASTPCAHGNPRVCVHQCPVTNPK